MNLDPCFTLYTKFNSKWVIDLNIRAKAIKLLGENIGINLCELGLGSVFLTIFLVFLGSDTKSTGAKRKIDKLDFIRIENFFASKNTIEKMEKTTQRMGENIYKSYV